MRTSIKTSTSLLAVLLCCFSLRGGSMFFGQNVSQASPVPLFYGYGCNGTTTNTCTIGGTPQAA